MASIVLLTENTGHAAATRTADALTSLGHTVTLIDDANVTTVDYSLYDLIVGVRLENARRGEIAAALRAQVDAGRPLLLSLMDYTVTAQTNIPCVVTDMRLTGNVDQRNATGGQPRTGIVIVDNTHPITAGLALGELTTHVGTNWQTVVNPNAPYVGHLLATGAPTDALTADRPSLIAIEQYTPDLIGQPIGARVVLWGALYAGQTDYTPAGVALLGTIVDWLLAPPEPVPLPPLYLVGVTTARTGVTYTVTLTTPANVQPGDLLIAAISDDGTHAINPPPGWTLGDVQTGTNSRCDWFTRVAEEGEPAQHTFSSAFSSFRVGAMVALRSAAGTPEIVAWDVATDAGTQSTLEAPSVINPVDGAAVLSLFHASSGTNSLGGWSAPAGVTVLWSLPNTIQTCASLGAIEYDVPAGPTTPREASTAEQRHKAAWTIVVAPPPPAPTEVAGRLGLAVDLTGTVHQAHQIAGRFGALASLVGEVEVPAFIRGRFAPLVALDGRVTADNLILGRLDLAARLAGTLELPAMVRGRFTAVADLRGTVQSPTRIIGRLEPLLDLRGMVHIPSQIRGRLAVDLALWGTLQTPAQITGRLALVAGLHGAVAVATEVRGRLLVLSDLREVATGPGTGIVASGLTEDAWLATLREGDTFRVIVPSAVPWGRTALARVLGRELDATGRLTLVLQLEGWPEPQRVLVQDTVSVPRYQPATALDPARRIVQTERAVAQVAARTTE